MRYLSRGAVLEDLVRVVQASIGGEEIPGQQVPGKKNINREEMPDQPRASKEPRAISKIAVGKGLVGPRGKRTHR